MSVESGLTYFEQHYFFSNKLFQYTMGLRSYQNSNHILIQVCILVVYIFPIIAQQFYQLIISDVTPEFTVKILQKILTGICIMSVYPVIYLSFEHMKQIFSKLKYDYEQLSGKDELKIMRKYNKEGKMYTYTLVIVCNFYFIATITPTILNIFSYHIGTSENINLTLPLPINNVFNSGTKFYTLLIYQTVAIFIMTFLASICFSYYLVLIQHGCCKLSVLRLKISQPFRDQQKLNQKVRCDKKIHNEFGWIVDVIEYYKSATEFVDLLNSVTKNIYLIVICIIMVLVALDILYILHLSTVLKNTWELIESSIYIVGSIFIIYINMYLGQLLINHSIETHAELCKIPFYMISIKVQKLLIFMILRSSKPCMLSIGGLFVASHEVFAGLMRKAFSLAMAYRSIR